MFEQLFGSKARVKLMKVFLENPEKRFYVRELTRLTDCLINSVRRELDNLMGIKLITMQEIVAKKDGEKKGLNAKKYYYLNEKNLFLQDLKNLFAKGQILLEKKLVERIKRLGEIKYIAFGGISVDNEKANTDLFVIGDLDKDKAVSGMAKFEKEVGKKIRYTIMNESEYVLRRDIADSFLIDFLEDDKKVVVLDQLKKRPKAVNHADIITK